VATSGFLCYYMRSVLSVVIAQIGSELGLSPAERAKALSSFFYGYMVSNAIASPLLQRYHPCQLILFAVLCSSLLTVMLPTAIGAWGHQGLLACRLVSGLTQGFLYPSIYGILGLELGGDPVIKTRALALVGGVSQLGVAVSFMGSPVLVGVGGWRLAVQIAGLLGLPWCLLWVASTVYGVPAVQHKDQAHPECDKSGGSEKQAAPAVPYRAILAAWPFRALVCGHFAHNWANAVVLAWLPTYLSQQLHVSGKYLGVSCLPYLAMAGASPLAGELAERLLRRRWDLWAVRRALGAGGLLCPALGLLIFPHIPEECWPGAVACVSLVMAFTTWVHSSVLASPLDLAGPRLSGTLFSITNGIAAVPCFLGIEAVGALRESFGWAAGFGLCSALYVVACGIYFRCGSARRLFD
jgi:sugar phosphate permease